MLSLGLDPTQAYSAASLGRTWLKSMGIRPVLERQPDFPKVALGEAMTTYYGGWAQCGVRRVPVPVVYVDFLSMYPTVCVLMGLWSFLACERIDVKDATEEVRAMLARLTLDDCLDPSTWSLFRGIAQVVPHGDVVPCRAPYGGSSHWGIGVNPLFVDEPIWYTILDLVASCLRTGRPPRVLRALKFVPHGLNPSLRAVTLRGAVTVDPCTQDFFKLVVEERKRAATRLDVSTEERQRLDRFLKVLANSTSYGIFVEVRRHELAPGRKEPVTVYGLDESPFTAEVTAPEEPGEFSFPPMGTLISGAGRLMLAILERLVTDAGGAFAFCDTDSMAIVATTRGGLVPCPGGGHRHLPDGRETVKALSWQEVEQIRGRFTTLNPYDRDAVAGSILKLEDVNFKPMTNRRRQLYCYAISAKRYTLFLLRRDGQPVLTEHRQDAHKEPIKLSEHGWGHLLNPADPEDEGRDWITTVWEGIVTEALGFSYSWPHWLNRPAASRLTISTASQLRLFDELNKGKAYADRIKPGNFLLSFHVSPFGHPPNTDPTRFHLFAPWNPDARQWLKMRAIDHYSNQTFRITTSGFAGSEGIARVKTVGDVIAEYRVNPEPKSLGSDGEPCGRATVGLLRRRPVTGIYLTYVGKESNRLEEVQAGVLHDPEEVLTEYPDPRRGPWDRLVLPVLRECPVHYLVNESGRGQSTMKHIRSGQRRPRGTLAAILISIAGAFARGRLEAWNRPAPKDDLAACFAYLKHKEGFDRKFSSTSH